MNEKFYQLPCGRREKIIRSAYQVFSRNEYKRASMSAIAMRQEFQSRFYFITLRTRRSCIYILSVTLKTLHAVRCRIMVYGRLKIFLKCYVGMSGQNVLFR